MLKVGDKAPDFCLPDQNGETHCLKDYLKKGNTVVLYFYPKDDTPGCTCEANEFTAIAKSFAGKKAVVLGVSADSVQSHKKFEEKYKLKIPLLSDTGRKTCEAYGVLRGISFFGKKITTISRSTFIIAKNGRIMLAFESVNPKGHAEEVLQKIS